MYSFYIDFASWVQGVLFILIAYHISAYFFTKDKSFVVYAAYLLMVFIYLIPKTNNESSAYLTSRFPSFFVAINWVIQVFYWLLYCWFGLLFLSIENKNKQLASKMLNYIKITFIIAILLFFIDFLVFNSAYFFWFFILIFMPTSLYIAFIFIKVVLKFNDKINTFFVVGLLFFLGFSIVSIVLSYAIEPYNLEKFRPINFFIFGVLIEAITLSIGLGYKFFLFREDFFKIEQLKFSFEIQINELKLASLHSQMNPHFIFNALNSIKLYIINNDQKKASYYLTKFSKLIRRILEASSKSSTTLKEELETIDLYLNIENIRFSNEIDFNFYINNTINLESIKIPPLLLQPFLENAIWHGLSSKKEDKKITVSIDKIDDNYIQIIIEDNGIGQKAAAKIKSEKSIRRKSIGIDLTKERLVHFVKKFKNDFSLVYEDLYDDSQTGIGTKVILKIPLF